MTKRRVKFDTSGQKPENVVQLAKKRFTHHDIASYEAKNPRQQKFLDLVKEDVPCILMDGMPAVGKTFLALAEALRLVLDPSTEYERVVYIRSAVPSGQDVGFLKGSLEEKQAPYEEVPKQTFARIIPKYNNPYPLLISLGYFEFLLDTHLRGINIANAVIVVDEAQCMDYASLKTILTRVDCGSRVFICGDEGQDDLKRKKKRSGLSHLKKVLMQMPTGSYGHVTFKTSDIVRGDGFTKDFIIADFETPEDE
jgi:predicted ribonuclease YlaK